MSNQINSLLTKYTTTEKYVSARVVADHLDLSVWTVYKQAEKCILKSYKFGRSRRFKLSEVTEK